MPRVRARAAHARHGSGSRGTVRLRRVRSGAWSRRHRRRGGRSRNLRRRLLGGRSRTGSGRRTSATRCVKVDHPRLGSLLAARVRRRGRCSCRLLRGTLRSAIWCAIGCPWDGRLHHLHARRGLLRAGFANGSLLRRHLGHVEFLLLSRWDRWSSGMPVDRPKPDIPWTKQRGVRLGHRLSGRLEPEPLERVTVASAWFAKMQREGTIELRAWAE